jgi:hypothetical protein
MVMRDSTNLANLLCGVFREHGLCYDVVARVRIRRAVDVDRERERDAVIAAYVQLGSRICGFD